MIITLSHVLNVAVAVVLISATFVLHRHLRHPSSLLLLVAVLLMFSYEILAPAILVFVNIYLGGLDGFWLWHRVAHPTLLLLAALAFLRVVLVCLRPRHSHQETGLTDTKLR